MVKTTITFFSLFFALSCFSQDTTKSTLKVTYKSIPVSQYQVVNNDSRNATDKALDLELHYAHKRYYSLLINLKDRASIYQFDSLNFVKPKGREDVQLLLADDLSYCIKTNTNATYKFETIFGRLFYTQGKVGNIEWEITKEKKQILGFDCTKAVSKDKELYLTVWFTNTVPVSSGPVNYFGLPGLVVWSEDFFRTTQIEKIEYSSDATSFSKKMNELQTDFAKNKKKGFLQEPLFVTKKKELIQSLRQMMNAQQQ